MNIGWVLADATVLDPTQDLTVLKNIGSFGVVGEPGVPVPLTMSYAMT